MKNTSKKPRNQVNYQRNLYHSPKKVSKSIIKDPVRFFNSLTKTDYKYLDNFFQTWSWHGKNFQSKKRIGVEIGVSERQVHNLNKKFWRLGLVNWHYRHRHTSLYNISVIFFSERVKYILAKVCPSITLLPYALSVLFAVNGGPENTGKTGIMYNNFLPNYYELYFYSYTHQLDPTTAHEAYLGTRAPNSRSTMNAIPKHIDDIKSINLTKAGKCRLLALTPAGIKAADKKIQSYKGKQVTSLFRLFFSIAASEGGEQPDRLADVATALEEHGCRQTDALLENDNINDVDASAFHKREGRSSKQAAWRPAHEDPYYRTEKQRSYFEQQRAKREQEWEQRPAEEQERLHKKAAEFRALLGIDENGEQIAEPDKAAGFLYHAAKKRWDEKQEPYTHDVPVFAESSVGLTPYIEEDGLWEEI